MRTVYVGTSEFAAEVLDRLALSPHRPQLVVTRPDRRKGRGRQLAPPPVAEAAARLGIETIQPENVNDDEPRARIAAAEQDEQGQHRQHGEDRGQAERVRYRIEVLRIHVVPPSLLAPTNLCPRPWWD